MKAGDIVVCIDDDSQDEDFGASGIVFKGRRDLRIGKEYEVEEVLSHHVPTQIDRHGIQVWSDEEYPKVVNYWTMLKLKGVKDAVWLHHFKLK